MTEPPFFERYLRDEGAAAYARKYDRSPARRLSARREAACVAGALKAAGASGTILDLPCGAGRFSALIRTFADRYLASDLSLPMVRICREVSDGPAAFLADVHRIPLPDRAVDGVAAIRLLHHFRNPAERRALLAELARVARRFLVVTFLDAGSVKQRMHAVKGRWRGRPSRRAAVTRGEMAADLREVGFRPVAFRSLSSLLSGQTALGAVRGDEG